MGVRVGPTPEYNGLPVSNHCKTIHSIKRIYILCRTLICFTLSHAIELGTGNIRYCNKRCIPKKRQFLHGSIYLTISLVVGYRTTGQTGSGH